MTRKEAVDRLMDEWGAKENFRPFFTRVVEVYMGEAKNVLASDYENIRETIRGMK